VNTSVQGTTQTRLHVKNGKHRLELMLRESERPVHLLYLTPRLNPIKFEYKIVFPSRVRFIPNFNMFLT
jgi:hypothetical protein